jgi:hypothetical protein
MVNCQGKAADSWGLKMRQKPVDVSRTFVLFLSLSVLRWAMSAPELNEMDDSERNSLNGGNLTVSEPDLLTLPHFIGHYE